MFWVLPSSGEILRDLLSSPEIVKQIWRVMKAFVRPRQVTNFSPLYHCFPTPFQAGRSVWGAEKFRRLMEGTTQVQALRRFRFVATSKCRAHQIGILDGQAQLVREFLVTQVSCGAVDRKLLEPISSCNLRRLTGVRSPNRAEALCASGCAISSYEVLAS